VATFWDRVARWYDRIVNVFDWHGDQLRIAEDICAGSVMKVCCGTGYLTTDLLKRGVDACGTDIAPKMVAKAQARLVAEGLDPERVSVADVTDLSFENGRFDDVGHL
jgi:SAM-dependent methyltransferase